MRTWYTREQVYLSSMHTVQCIPITKQNRAVGTNIGCCNANYVKVRYWSYSSTYCRRCKHKVHKNTVIKYTPFLGDALYTALAALIKIECIPFRHIPVRLLIHFFYSLLLWFDVCIVLCHLGKVSSRDVIPAIRLVHYYGVAVQYIKYSDILVTCTVAYSKKYMQHTLR